MQSEHVSAYWLVAQERTRQGELKRSGKFVYGAEDPELTDAELLTVLTEEVGEVAQEICPTIGHPELRSVQQRIRLRDELVQVAAVAVGRIELLNAQIARAQSGGAL